MKNRLRIELSAIGDKSRVFYGDQDISDCIEGLTLSTRVGELTKATLEVIVLGGVTGEARPSEMVIRDIAAELDAERAA